MDVQHDWLPGYVQHVQWLLDVQRDWLPGHVQPDLPSESVGRGRLREHAKLDPSPELATREPLEISSFDRPEQVNRDRSWELVNFDRLKHVNLVLSWEHGIVDQLPKHAKPGRYERARLNAAILMCQLLSFLVLASPRPQLPFSGNSGVLIAQKRQHAKYLSRFLFESDGQIIVCAAPENVMNPL